MTRRNESCCVQSPNAQTVLFPGKPINLSAVSRAKPSIPSIYPVSFGASESPEFLSFAKINAVLGMGIQEFLLRIHLTFSCPGNPDQSIGNVRSSSDYRILTNYHLDIPRKGRVCGPPFRQHRLPALPKKLATLTLWLPPSVSRAVLSGSRGGLV